VFDNAIPSRARLTCPAGLVIKQVKTEDGKTCKFVKIVICIIFFTTANILRSNYFMSLSVWCGPPSLDRNRTPQLFT
jgi:hypothetical protein